ncbi:hypothetical protein CGRA01v4_12966 [Colletotrichum graminicola]|nr:hypothetical protein CGRA01v4_12966 [Colletotrichum graminicola]
MNSAWNSYQPIPLWNPPAQCSLDLLKIGPWDPDAARPVLSLLTTLGPHATRPLLDPLPPLPADETPPPCNPPPSLVLFVRVIHHLQFSAPGVAHTSVHTPDVVHIQVRWRNYTTTSPSTISVLP